MSEAPVASAAYQGRLTQATAAAARLERQAFWISLLRLATVLAILVTAWLAIQSRLLPLFLVLLPVILFVFLLAVHERVLRRATRARNACELYREALRRLDDRWSKDGEQGERFAEANTDHLYGSDLDLFGQGSLFQLLCRARSANGQQRLANWLLQPATAAEALARQAAVRELAPELDFRERLAILGQDSNAAIDSANLLAWSRQPPVFERHRLLRVGTLLLALTNVAAALLWWPLGEGPTALLALTIVELLAFMVLRRRLTLLTAGVARTARELAGLAEALQLIEGAEWETEWLRQHRQSLRHAADESTSVSASAVIDQLRRLVELGDSMRNPMFVPFGILLLWGVQVGLAIDAWRARHAAHIETWLDAIGELEAISSLAWFAFENPSFSMPEIVDEPEVPRLVATQLGHPLLPRGDGCELNDVALGLAPACEAQAFVISGSNMSGKSTFLRSCGTNTVLALAGAPVRAHHMQLTPLAIGASIRIQDSLQEGSSKFYAEITRLRAILDLSAGELPTLFLLDEILHGTNSHDRRIGAEAAVNALIERGAIGLVTTHDLALAAMASAGDSGAAATPLARPPAMVNKHFVDHLEGGRIRFDYKLRPGVVTRSNALALMREVGLDV